MHFSRRVAAAWHTYPLIGPTMAMGAAAAAVSLKQWFKYDKLVYN